MSAGVYELPEEHQDFRATIRQLAQERIAPRAAEIDAADEYPWDIRRLLAEHDVLALPFEERHGGTGTGTLMLQVAVAKACELSYYCEFRDIHARTSGYKIIADLVVGTLPKR